MDSASNSVYNPNNNSMTQMPSIEAVDPLAQNLSESRTNQQGVLPGSIKGRLLSNNSGVPVKILDDGTIKHLITPGDSVASDFTFSFPHGLNYIPYVAGFGSFSPIIASTTSVNQLPYILSGLSISVGNVTTSSVVMHVLALNVDGSTILAANIGRTLYFKLYCFNYTV